MQQCGQGSQPLVPTLSHNPHEVYKSRDHALCAHARDGVAGTAASDARCRDDKVWTRSATTVHGQDTQHFEKRVGEKMTIFSLLSLQTQALKRQDGQGA